MEQTAERIAEAGSLVLPGDTFTIYYYVRQRLMDLALVAVVTGEERYRLALKRAIRELAAGDLNFWIGPEYPNRPRFQIYKGEKLSTGELETATLSMGLSVAYDWAYSILDEEDRRIIMECLKDKAYPLLRNSTLFQSDKWVMNHLCVIASALSTVLLVLEPEGDTVKPEDYKLVERALGLWMKTMDTDGSYGEGYHYWAYPVNCLFFGLYPLKRLKGIELPEAVHMRKCLEWAVYNQVGRYRIEGYSRPVAVAVNAYDSPFLFQLEAPEALLYANLFGDPLGQWYIRTYLLDNPPRPDALHTVWHLCNSLLFALYDPSLEGSSPAQLQMAPSRVFHDTGFVYLRDSWERCADGTGDQVLSVQSGGGGKANSHQHYDKNSFSLFAKGEYWIVDPGHSCYRGPLHKGYDNRTCAHNTVSVNGQDQVLNFVERGMDHAERKAYISHHNRAEVVSKRFYPQVDYIESRGERCYEPYLREFSRRIWFVRPDYYVIWDRLDIGDQPGELTSGFNLNNRDGRLAYTVEGSVIRSSRPHSDLYIEAVSPQDVAFAVEAGRLHDAYHILPGQQVEGAEGSAVRFNFVPADGGKLRAADLVYIIAPLDKGAEAPKVKLTALEADPAHEHRFNSMSISVVWQGREDHFSFRERDAAMEQSTGACYRF
jgi:hypothetical protein